MRISKLPAIAAALLASTLAAGSAGAVTYTFTSASTFELGPTVGGFSFVAPGFITANITVPTPANCTVVATPGVTCGAQQQFLPDSSSLVNPPQDIYDAIGFGLSTSTYYFYFADGAFGAFGTYNTVTFGADQAGVLVISPDAVPEPAGWAMMIAGIGAIGGALRRRPRTSVRFAIA